MRFSFPWGVGEVAMNRRFGCDEFSDRQWAENHGEQYQQRHLLHGPERRDVVRVEQVLRGKIPVTVGTRVTPRPPYRSVRAR